MPEERSDRNPTLALNTKVEQDFITPLTVVRGALEILRDYPDLTEEERQRFVETALRGCARLEIGVEQLAHSIYAASQRDQPRKQVDLPQAAYREFANRIRFFDEMNVIEVNFSDYQFPDATTVNRFYDFLDASIEGTRRHWYLIVNYKGCAIWPDAWVAFAHRGKKVNSTYSKGTVRYAEPSNLEDDAGGRKFGADGTGTDLLDSREAALSKIEELKRLQLEQC